MITTIERADAAHCAQPTQDALADAACAQACAAIAPAWPLDRAIAVNPHWNRIGLPLRRVAARMAALAGIRVLPERERQRTYWNEGRIARADLETALAQTPAARAAGLTAQRCVAALDVRPDLRQLPLLIDLLDSDPRRDERLSWRQAVTHQVGQVCAAYFDGHQADWQPARGGGLYAFWRDTLRHDHGIGTLMGLPRLHRALAALPATRQEAERWVLRRLALAPSAWADYLEAVLLTVNGWASYCAWLGWEAGQAGRADGHLRDLLAIRLAWGALLLECADGAAAAQAFTALRAAWGDAGRRLAALEDALMVDEVWQAALDASYRRGLAASLAGAAGTAPAAAEVQAAFCIDVRSEPLRRALETAWPAVHTIGCAGFFGLPAAYTPLGTAARRPQLPGLFAPALEIGDRIDTVNGDADARRAAAARRNRLAAGVPWDAAARWPGAAFSFVEAAGIGYFGGLARWLRPGRRARTRDDLAGLPARDQARVRPRVALDDVDGRVALAAAVLRGMGLTQGFAPLVLLVGHGSQTHNNAHAAALDCGACCGQTGEVNARALAGLLNDAAVRAGLRAHAIAIPDATWFVPALHNTTTDEIEAFDLDLMPAAAAPRWTRLRAVLERASDQVRRERAGALGVDAGLPRAALLAQLRRRANDGAQTRPEWGLAGNAAFVIAPRARTRGAALRGRVFLHDYDPQRDPDGSRLEALMTAPMLVTHWINWQYHASTCDPERLGSGNKLLHNVVGGRVGVFEGNGGDLRVGLARQSLHDGKRWMHEPVRLAVVVDAPAAAIERVLAGHAVVRDLVGHGWLHLLRFGPDGLLRYADGAWHADGT